MTETNAPALTAPRSLAVLAAMALLFALFPLAGGAGAHILGEVVTKDSADGLVTSTRFAGEQRFATSALIATNTAEFANSDTVLIARADEFPDSLAGNYLAGQLGVPILLLDTNTLIHDTLEAIRAVGAQNAVILGGTAAISAENEQSLQNEGLETRRIGGASRFETAAMIAETGTVGTHDGRRTAILASGEKFPDALVTGSLAYAEDFPLLLTAADQLPDATTNVLNDRDIEQVIIPGGLSVVSDEVRSELRDRGITLIELSGPTRVDTAAAVARFAVDELGFTAVHANLARGDKFPDALTIGPHVGVEESVLLLTVDPTRIDSDERPVEEFLTDHACDIGSLHIAGGTAAIADTTEDTLRELATGEACTVTLEPQSATNTVGETHTVTATVTDEFQTTVPGVDVTFVASPETATPPASTAEPMPESATATTDASGQATFTFTSSTPGAVTITATFTRAGGEETSATARKVFTADATATMTGLQEVPPVVTNASGFTALGIVEPASAGGEPQLCFGIRVEGHSSPIIGLHVHEGAVGSNGPPVVNLASAIEALNIDGVAANCVGSEALLQAAQADEFAQIQATPSDYYVNVHTENNPDGEIRGQLG